MQEIIAVERNIEVAEKSRQVRNSGEYDTLDQIKSWLTHISTIKCSPSYFEDSRFILWPTSSRAHQELHSEHYVTICAGLLESEDTQKTINSKFYHGMVSDDPDISFTLDKCPIPSNQRFIVTRQLAEIAAYYSEQLLNKLLALADEGYNIHKAIEKIYEVGKFDYLEAQDFSSFDNPSFYIQNPDDDATEIKHDAIRILDLDHAISLFKHQQNVTRKQL